MLSNVVHVFDEILRLGFMQFWSVTHFDSVASSLMSMELAVLFLLARRNSPNFKSFTDIIVKAKK